MPEVYYCNPCKKACYKSVSSGISCKSELTIFGLRGTLCPPLLNLCNRLLEGGLDRGMPVVCLGNSLPQFALAC